MALNRSQQMARIKGQHTKPEMLLRRALWARGVRYRVHYKTPVGRPDVVFPGPRLAVFVDGCQWHGCPDHYVRPRSRNAFWAEKLRTNVERDQRQTLALEAAGWTTLRFWEHAIHEQLDAVVDRVLRTLVHGHPPDDDVAWRVIAVDVIDPAIDLEARHLVGLRRPDLVRTVQRVRSTRKWKRRVD